MSLRDTSMPRPAQAFVEFVQVLRARGYPIAPEQTAAFIEAIGLLGPKEIGDIRRAGLAMLAISRDRQAEYDALFRAFFMGQIVAAPATSEEDDQGVDAHEDAGGAHEVEILEEEDETGGEASASEALSRRTFRPRADDESIRSFSRHAPALLPRRRSYRRTAARRGDAFDMRRSMRQAVRNDGEVFDLLQTRRKTRQRPIVLLIDVSGSMQEQSEQNMRFAHALFQAADRVEVFTFGTRLTRVTRALTNRRIDIALERASRLVADFDGGTRIGEALDALLSVPRFAGTMRGALVLVVSDGLERGDPAMMADAVRRISMIAWRTDWLSPLAGDPGYQPRTEALSAALPFLDSVVDGGSIDSICRHVLGLASTPDPGAGVRWRTA